MDEAQPRLTSRQLYWRLLGYVRPHWKRFMISVVAMVVSALCEPFFAWMMKPLTQNFVTPDPHGIYWVPLAVIGVFVLRGIATITNEYTISWISGTLVQTLRSQMFDRLVTLPLSFFNKTPSGTLISKLTYDVTQVSMAGVNILTVTVKDSITILGLIGLLVYTDWLLTVICVTVIPLVAVTIRVISKRLRQLSHNAQASMGNMTAVLDEAIEGHRVVKVFGGEQYESTRFSHLANLVRRIEVKQSLASSANSNIVQLLVSIALAVIIYVASVRSVSGGMTAGDFMSFMTAMLMLFAPLKRITSVSAQLQKGLAAAESVFGLIDQEPERNAGSVHLGRTRGELVFDHMSFHYGDSDKPAIDQLNLTITAGQTVALVGASGSGKTTLANLIPRFFSPSSGEIRLDGHNLADIDLYDLRRQIALVSQEVVLFNDSVAANIAYGRREASREEVEAAARAAHAHEFIAAMPEGYDTLIGENGIRLSGGQRQRLAIARAILKNAPILILDEATSALDTESERHVQAALENLMQGRTTVVIAHRLSTIEKADCIVVMQKGRIIEQGTHGELLTHNGAYADLHRMQFSDAPGA